MFGSGSSYRKWVLFAFSFGSVSIATGLMYGWPALRRQLVMDDGSTLDESQLGIIFTSGAWSTQGMRFFMGLARDRFGTRWTAFASFVFVALGSLGMALSDPNDIFALAVSSFALGTGSSVQICVQPVAGLFPNYKGTILASLSGAFQISGVIFLALCSGDTSRRFAFLLFMGCLLCFAFLSVILLPKGQSFLLEDGKGNENNDLPESKRSMPQAVPVDAAHKKHIDIVEMKKDYTLTKQKEPLTALQQIKSLEYFFLVSWFSICVFPLQYYVGSIGFQLEEKGDTDGFYTGIFSVVYASSVVFAPIGGYLADRAGLGITQGLSVLFLALSFLFLNLEVELDIQIVGLTLYGCARMFIYGMFFANVGKRFGFQNFGTLAGSGLLISAIVSLLQYPLIASAAEGNSETVNFSLVFVCALLLPYCYWLHQRESTADALNQKEVPDGGYSLGMEASHDVVLVKENNTDDSSQYSWENDSEYSC